MTPAPSEMLVELRQAGRGTWMQADAQPQLRDLVESIETEVSGELSGPDSRGLGSGIFAFGSEVLLKHEAFTKLVTGSRRMRAEEFSKGVVSGSQITCLVGDHLIDRGEDHASTAPESSPLTVADTLRDNRAKLVDAARGLIVGVVADADLAATLIRAVFGPDEGPDRRFLVTKVADGIAGVDLAQAGWGLIVCGTSLVSRANDAAPEQKRSRWRGDQAGADLLAMGLVGAMDVIAGNELIERASGAGAP